MSRLFQLGEYAGFILFVGFFAVIFWKMIGGGIVLDGLLDGKTGDGNRSFSPERALLLLLTLLTAGKYILAVSQNPQVDSLPELPAELVLVLGGSQAIYVGAKAWSTFIPLFKKPN